MKHPDQETLSAMMDGEWHTSDARRAVVDVCRDDVLRACWGRYHLARDAMHAEALDVHGSVAGRVAAALADEPAYTNVTAIGGASVAGHGPGAGSTAGTSGDERPAPADEEAAGPSGIDVPSAGTPAVVRVASGRGATIRTFATGFGLAASVALVTAVGLNAWQGEAAGSPNALGATASSDASPVPDGTANGVAGPVRPDATAVASAAPADAFSLQLPGAPLPRVELVSNTGAYWSASNSSARRPDSEARLNMFLSRHIENSPTAERQGMLPYSRLVGYDERPEAR